MGFFSRFKSDEKKKASSKAQPRTPVSDSSTVATSQFSLANSQSSNSSQDNATNRLSTASRGLKKPLPNPIFNRRSTLDPRAPQDAAHLISSFPSQPPVNVAASSANARIPNGPPMPAPAPSAGPKSPSPVDRSSVSPPYSHDSNSIANSNDFNRFSQESPPSEESLLNQLAGLHVSHKPVSHNQAQSNKPQQSPLFRHSHQPLSSRPRTSYFSSAPQLNPTPSRTVPNSPMHQQQAFPAPSRVSHSASTSILSTFALPNHPVREDSGDYTSTETSAETSAELSEDEDARKHPYYEQWKQYYATLAAQNQNAPQQQQQGPYGSRPYINPVGQSSRTSIMPHSRSNSSGLNSVHSYGAQQPQKNAYLQYVNSMDAKKAESNGLIQNSRMSTLKLNRSCSSPLLASGADPKVKARSVSVNVTGPEPTPAQNADLEPIEDAQPSKLGAPSTKSMSFGLLAMAQSEKEHGSEFKPSAPFQPPTHSDSALYSSHSESSVDTNGHLTGSHNEASDPLSTTNEQQIKREDSGISDYEMYLFNGTMDDSIDQDTSYDHTVGPDNKAIGQEIANDLAVPEPPQGITPHGSIHDKNRQNGLGDSGDLTRNPSAASGTSYNSLQSEKNFTVGRAPTRLATQTDEQRNLSRKIKAAKKSAKTNSFVPPMAGPPPPIFTGFPSMPPAASPMNYPPSVSNFNGSSDNLSMDGATMQIQQMQQQIQQLQQMQQMHQQMQMMYPNPRNSQMPPSPTHLQPKSTDPSINIKIEEFILLREQIAAGHKTYDYRLKWVKMLITAVVFKLYAYINIKGDSIPHEQATMNKLSFVKLSVTHLQKMLKDLDTDRLTPPDKRVFAEVCYIYGCLLMHDYMPKYEQDFNVMQDKDEADRFFRKCLELNPHFFKAHYKLAELFEQDQTEECFDTALFHYTQSAKLGYNRAIYQVALIYLTVPKVRLTKYFKYLRSLSEIDMTSKDIKLTAEDRDELEEVAGLACFQLAKIYEGIYPGDLSAEDQFVQDSLELAPVNYAKSLSFYNRSAKLNCLQAQVRLGHVYENGDLNRRHNPSKSIQWFIKASTSPLKFRRHPEAMLGISRWFMVGTDGESKHIPYADPQRALMWCDRAIKEFNFAEAYYAMGQFAEQGLAQGTPAEWYSEAYRLGYLEAGEKLQDQAYDE